MINIDQDGGLPFREAVQFEPKSMVVFNGTFLRWRCWDATKPIR